MQRVQPMRKILFVAIRQVPPPTPAELLPEIAMARSPPACPSHSAADKQRATTQACPWRASCQHSRAAAPLRSHRAQASSANAETGLLPCPPGPPAETP